MFIPTVIQFQLHGISEWIWEYEQLAMAISESLILYMGPLNSDPDPQADGEIHGWVVHQKSAKMKNNYPSPVDKVPLIRFLFLYNDIQ